MEETGHYYTVYYTSLAVGFDKDLAYQHAVLAQMPDEVGFLDAANMHEKEGLLGYEYDLNGTRKKVLHQDRYKHEYGLHVLVDENLPANIRRSEFQQDITRELLRLYNARSLEFGLLLHRLGDTYSHSILGNGNTLYTTTTDSVYSFPIRIRGAIGHGKDNNLPDYWFIRLDDFYKYLEDLFNVLSNKLKETQPSAQARLTYQELKSNYARIITYYGYVMGIQSYPFEIKIKSSVVNLFDWLLDMRSRKMINLIIVDLRKQIQALLGSVERNPIEQYRPEISDNQKLSEFASATKFKLSPAEVQRAVDAVSESVNNFSAIGATDRVVVK